MTAYDGTPELPDRVHLAPSNGGLTRVLAVAGKHYGESWIGSWQRPPSTLSIGLAMRRATESVLASSIAQVWIDDAGLRDQVGDVYAWRRSRKAGSSFNSMSDQDVTREIAYLCAELESRTGTLIQQGGHMDPIVNGKPLSDLTQDRLVALMIAVDFQMQRLAP